MPLGHFHFDLLTFTERFSPGTDDCTVMDENVLTVILLNETETFFVIEPLYCA